MKLKKPKVYFVEKRKKWGVDYEELIGGKAKRIRLIRFDTKKEAEKAQAKIGSQQIARESRATFLTDEQTRQALWAFEELANLPFKNNSLTDAISYYKFHYAEAAKTPRIKIAVEDFLDFKRENLKPTGFNSLRGRLRNMANHFEEKMLGEISALELISFFEEKTIGVQKQYIKDCGGFFSHVSDLGNPNRILTENPFGGVRFHFRQKNKGRTARKGVPTVLHLIEVKKALQVAMSGFEITNKTTIQTEGGDWLAFVVLGCFCGLRPSEIENLSKQENVWRDFIKILDGKIVINEKINEKTSDHRLIDMRGNVKEWLRYIKENSFPLHINPYRKKWHYPRFREEVLGERAKDRTFVDVWRHTYCTWLINDTDKEGRTITLDYVTAQMGHSAQVNQKHYRGKLHDGENAADFWNLKPSDFK